VVPGCEFRRGPDGWHAIVPLGGAIHRLCLPVIPEGDSLFAVELRLDASFDIRLQAAHRFLSAIEGRRLGTPPLALPRQRRQRFILTIRALDAWLQGHSYREIAEGLFGKERVMGRSWRANDLRLDAGWLSRTVTPTIAEAMSVRSGVPKTYPPIFGIPL
jgi:hypothetical protein